VIAVNGTNGGTSQVSAREILTVVFRRRVPVVLVAVVVAAAALTAASRTSSVYNATAKVLLRRMGPSPLATAWTPFYGLEEEMNTEVQIVNTLSVMERAAEILRAKGVFVVKELDDTVITREPTAGDIGAGLSAAPIDKSNIILIHFRGANPEFAREAADAAAQAYVEHRVPVRMVGGLEDYFEDQMAAVTQRLLDLKQTELELQKQGEIYDLEWQQRTAIGDKSELRLRLAEVRSERVTEEHNVAAIERRMKEIPDLLLPFSKASGSLLFHDMIMQYWRVRAERDDKASKLTDSSPEVRMLDERIAKMEDRLREEAERRLLEKRFLVEDLRAQEMSLEAEMTEISNLLRKTPDIVGQIEHLQKEIYYTYLHYEKLIEKMLDAIVSEANDVRISNAKVISPATVQLTRAGQMKTAYIVFSIALGVTLGIGFGFLLENLDHSVKSADDVEDVIGVPLLGSIPDARGLSKATKRIDRLFGPDSS
jgi:succinoglycan biosynthesis transport protein ExoP